MPHWALEALVLDEVIECLCQHPFWLWAAHEEKAKVKHMKQVDEWASTLIELGSGTIRQNQSLCAESIGIGVEFIVPVFLLLRNPRLQTGPAHC